jgi:N-acetylmuramic acid 6-phosphate etherase
MSKDQYSKAHREAEHFLNHEQQFHLGILPTEQSNPKTRNLDAIFKSNPMEGVKTLLSVDRDITPVAEKTLNDKAFREMVEAGVKAISSGRKIIFSGCGSTGRLSILLEGMWRHFFRDVQQFNPETYDKIKTYEHSIFSIMTGGDYALIRAVESFEDYMEFGRQQAREMGITEGDVMVAITEGGETSSVLGTLEEAANRGANAFLMFNNPTDVLRKHIERSKKAIDDPRVTVLDLYCGPMAIAGSTRMQATTSELLVAGAALEMILGRIFQPLLSEEEMKSLNFHEINYPGAFEEMLNSLTNDQNTKTLAEYINLERDIYQENGLVTYFADELLMDILTDTTERSPTFMLSPYKQYDDNVSPPSWSFVKHPLRPTPDTLEYMLGRQPRCLDWDSNLYKKLGAEAVASAPPRVNKQELLKFLIGNEEDPSRTSQSPNVAIAINSGRETGKKDFGTFMKTFRQSAGDYDRQRTLIIGNSSESADYQVDHPIPSSPLHLMERLMVKLTLNTISTGTMVMMGRVTSNWMSWVNISNKKLRDRAIRLISELSSVSYEKACYALHETLEEFENFDVKDKNSISPVQYTIKKIKSTNK